MPSPSLATPDDLAVRIPGGLPADDLPRAQAVLDDASALVRSYCGRTWLTEGGDLDAVPDVVVTVTLAVAARAFLNPTDGITQTSIDSYSESYSSGGCYLTKTEKKMLAGLNTSGVGGLWTLGTTRVAEPDYEPSAWVSTTEWLRP